MLQFLFHGYTNFVFPVAFFLCCGAKTSELLTLACNVIAELWKYGFQVDYIMYNGASSNRAFLKMMTPLNPIQNMMKGPTSLSMAKKTNIQFVD